MRPNIATDSERKLISAHAGGNQDFDYVDEEGDGYGDGYGHSASYEALE
jgi:hypothetical protein